MNDEADNVDTDEMDQDATPGRGRKLVQFLLAFNFLLVATSCLLPSYAQWRLHQLEDDSAFVDRTSGHIGPIRNEFRNFYQHGLQKDYLEAIYAQISRVYPNNEYETAEYQREIDLIRQDWQRFVEGYAYTCSYEERTPEGYTRQFLIARRALARIDSANIRADRDRAEQLDAVPLDQLIVFKCALRQLHDAVAPRGWVLPVTGEQGDASWEDTLRAAETGLSDYQSERWWRFTRLREISNRSTTPFVLSTVQDLEALETDFSGQITARRRDRDAARFTIPLIALPLDAKMLEYTILLVLLLVLTESAVFHRSLFRRRVPVRPGGSWYFRFLRGKGTARSRLQPRRLFDWPSVMTDIERRALLLLLYAGPFAALFGHGVVTLRDAAELDDLWRLWSMDTFALSVLALAILGLTRCNLAQLTLLETRQTPPVTRSSHASPPRQTPAATPAPEPRQDVNSDALTEDAQGGQT